MEIAKNMLVRYNEETSQQHIGTNLIKQDTIFREAIDKLYDELQCHPFTNSGFPKANVMLDYNEVTKMFKTQSEAKGSADEVFYPEVKLKEMRENRQMILNKIDEIFANINSAADVGVTPTLTIRNQKLWSNCLYEFDRVTLKSVKEAKKTTVTYSATADKSKFRTILFVLSKVHELVSKNLTCTRRELYYQNIACLRSQSTLDAAVRDVCCLLESPPWALGVMATAKGLIAGNLVYITKDGFSMDCSAAGGTLVPQDVSGIRSFKSSAKYILVVEKDAIFQKLLDEGALDRLGPVIIITGKGYPDLITRQMLNRLTKELKLPALCLVDVDPYGYEIFLTYKFGSLAQSHLSESLACPRLALVGARCDDIKALAPQSAQLPLTALDRRKLTSLLARPYLQAESGKRIADELRTMQQLGLKAELECIASLSAATLCDAYLPSKIVQRDFLT